MRLNSSARSSKVIFSERPNFLVIRRDRGVVRPARCDLPRCQMTRAALLHLLREPITKYLTTSFSLFLSVLDEKRRVNTLPRCSKSSLPLSYCFTLVSISPVLAIGKFISRLIVGFSNCVLWTTSLIDQLPSWLLARASTLIAQLNCFLHFPLYSKLMTSEPNKYNQ